MAFRIDEGRNLNSFLRDGPVAAHLLLRSGTQPRLLVAFPAGNSGVGLWFADTDVALKWTLATPPKALSSHDAKRRRLQGIEFDVEVDARELRPRAAVLSSVRILRDYELQRTAPAEVMVAPRLVAGALVWARDRLDGAAGYRLSIAPVDGTRVTAERFTAPANEPLRLKVRAMTGEAPLRPQNPLLTANVRDDARAQQALQFLSYEDKFLAGSWRFNTYFGRDTLISALLLAPVLQPAAMESAIGSVLDRLAPNGEVAHEEDIGEFAVWRHLREGRGRVDVPIYDYGMVDDDFLLAPLVTRWIAEARAHEDDRAANFLRRGSRGELLVRNLVWVVERASAFAADPRAHNLVAIKPGRQTGNWRDSEQGLARGRYAYDVNAALVPAALDAAAVLAESGLLDAHLDASQRQTLSRAKAIARVWSARAPGPFLVRIPAAEAQREVKAYASEQGLGESVPEASRGGTLRFNALSLDADGKPIPVVHSDEGFRLLLTEPSAQELEDILTILRPFPIGLVTDIGIVVANPAQASAAIEREFSRNAYHGTVVWSWQQALLAAGLDRQLRRADLPAKTRAELLRARATVWKAIASSRELRTSELWSWSYSDGRFRLEPFGGRGADADESNAAQLWSTVFLGLTPPSR